MGLPEFDQSDCMHILDKEMGGKKAEGNRNGSKVC
jgi:hypothetical protein